MRKLGDEGMSQSDTVSAIDHWLEEKLSRESKTAPDIAECMKVFALASGSLGSAIRYAEHLFAQTGTVHFSTGHKAKGLEWDHVYHLDAWRIGDDEQEQNLSYVINTRSKDRLYMIDGGSLA